MAPSLNSNTIMLRRFLIAVLLLGTFCLVAGGVVATWGYFYITRDLPQISRMQDYKPAAVSQVLAADGTLVAEFYRERRYPVSISEVPQIVRKAFLAAEDASFYQHAGIDFLSILRAAYRNMRSGSMRQGGSTITQQVVKNLLLTSERSIERKAKEAILSYQLEHTLTKDEIFEIYLNEIFFGNNAYGVKAAARAYFRKELADLTLAEAAMLASLPKAPTAFSPLINPKRAKIRQMYVLDQMVKLGWATTVEADEARTEKLRYFPGQTQVIYQAPFYVSEVRRILTEAPEWKGLDIDADGLEIHTALNLEADRMASWALRRGLREVDKRRGWRGPLASGVNDADYKKRFAEYSQEVLKFGEVYPALVTKIGTDGSIGARLGTRPVSISRQSLDWAKKHIDGQDTVAWLEPLRTIKVGDVVEVSFAEPRSIEETVKELPWIEKPVPLAAEQVHLDQTPDLEGAIVLLDPRTGQVATTIGGYSYRRSQFNRVTQAFRQPGSSFKPIVYLAAIDGYQFTPATIVMDEPRSFKVGDEIWTPGNFDGDFLGPITLRTALEKSRNLVSADLTQRISVGAVIRYARKLGLVSPLGQNLSISLGSSEVTMLELARAYGVFAAEGNLADSIFITKIIDRKGKVLFDELANRAARNRQVVNKASTFVLTNMMRGVVDRGTATRLRSLKRPLAGKTGTSNDHMDAWFIGFNPSWVSGIWIGYDVKREIGNKETGGRAAVPIFEDFMGNFLKNQDEKQYQRLVADAQRDADELGLPVSKPERQAPEDFAVPPGVEAFSINRLTGAAVDPEDPEAFVEYFVSGTEPNATGLGDLPGEGYFDSPDL